MAKEYVFNNILYRKWAAYDYDWVQVRAMEAKLIKWLEVYVKDYTLKFEFDLVRISFNYEEDLLAFKLLFGEYFTN